MPVCAVNGIKVYFGAVEEEQPRSGTGPLGVVRHRIRARRDLGLSKSSLERRHAFFAQDRQALPDVLTFLDGPT
jgi:hypothetical protein